MTEQSRQKLERHIADKKLRWTRQRQHIVDVFLQSRQHLSCEELFERVRARRPEIGYATVARTLHLLVEAGVCMKTDLSDGTMRYEIVRPSHHDHLVCTLCGRLVEVCSPELERLQAKLVKDHGFSEEYHKLTIFGVCPQCRRQTASART